MPDATAGPNVALVRPASNRIEDTKSLHSTGGGVIVNTALQATPEKPLVVVTGGQLTAVADAYLQNPAIANRIIVSGIFGALNKTYNAGLDAWAWTIVISKFRCLSFSDSDTDVQYNQAMHSACSQTPKNRFLQEIQDGILPQTVFYQWMLEKHHPRHPSKYMEQDGDSPAAIVLMRPDYITKIERWRCTGIDINGLPKLVPDNKGPLYLVTQANGSVATDEFWRAIENRASWKHKN